jgi:hypothetical protein
MTTSTSTSVNPDCRLALLQGMDRRMEVILETSWKPLHLCREQHDSLGDSGGIAAVAAQIHAACANVAVLVTKQVHLSVR